MTAAPLIALLCALAALTVWRARGVVSLRPAAAALTALALTDVARLWTAKHAPRMDVVASMLWPVMAAWLVMGSRAAPKDEGPEAEAPSPSSRLTGAPAVPYFRGGPGRCPAGAGITRAWPSSVRRALYHLALPLAILAYAITLALVGRRLAAHWTLALQAPRVLVGAVAAYVAVRARVRHEWPGWSPAIGCVMGLGQILALSAWGAWETTVRAMSVICWLVVAVLVVLAR